MVIGVVVAAWYARLDGSAKKGQKGQRNGAYRRWNVLAEGKNVEMAGQGKEEGYEFGGSRFPRDVARKVPAGPVLSPRQDDQPAVLNIKPTCTGSLSSTRYPNLLSSHPSATPRPRSTTDSPPLSAIKTYA